MRDAVEGSIGTAGPGKRAIWRRSWVLQGKEGLPGGGELRAALKERQVGVGQGDGEEREGKRLL